MGLVVWLSAGVVAFLCARIIPAGRGKNRIGELLAALGVALLLGLAATAADFGGWREPDPRAAVFTFLGALAAAGVVRLFRTV